MEKFMIQEWGIVGVIIVLFIGMLHFLKTQLISKLSEIEQISIKLIDRWNRSDEISLRHREDIVKELNDVTDDLSYIKGRMNGKD
tara:strand:+ start:63 stop:317 length:255 start_codon:yes stop_codon:yes gene_type:complete